MVINHTDTENSDPIISWANRRPYWEKYIWSNCLGKGQLTPDEISQAYNYFLQENNMQDVAGRPKIDLHEFLPPDKRVLLPRIKLKTVKDCKNINAIPSDGVIQFGENVTLIYGGNGSGKSGFGRLFANACFSKGSRKILPNLRNIPISTESPQATFTIDNGSGADSEILYKGDSSASIPELKRFSVFDSKSVPVHLDNASTIQFTPGQLEIFDIVNTYISKIEALFEEHKKDKYRTNPVELLFGTEQSKVASYLRQVNNLSDRNEILRYTHFSEGDEKMLATAIEEKEKKIRLDIPGKKSQLKTEYDQLASYRITLENFRLKYSLEKIASINVLIKDLLEKEAIVKQLGTERFDDGLLKSIGSDEWRALLTSAKLLYDSEIDQGNEINHCLLCKQELGVKEKSLFDAYWEFLGSKAESALKKISTDLLYESMQLEQVNMYIPNTGETHPAIRMLMESGYSEYVLELQKTIAEAKQHIENWVQAIKDKKLITSSDFSPISLTGIEKLIELKVKATEALVDPKEDIEKLTETIVELEHKKKVAPLRGKILDYYEYLQWNSKASYVSIPKRAYTDERKELFNLIVTDDYKDLFNHNCKELHCNLGLTPQTRGVRGDTVIELKLDFANAYNPTEVLSEGEQKVAALADFLTEVELDENNCGIIFDDPVTSLDHDWKELIAERLVVESKKRQVIIFTHDIVFFLSIQEYATRNGLTTSITTIRKVGETVGIIKPEIPWVAQNVSDRVRYLRNKLVPIEKAERNGVDQDEQIESVKLWYLLLREGWERAVEERLFNRVVERFRSGLETQRLKTLSITPELIRELVIGMTDSSKWLHDRSTGLNVPVPHASILQGHLKQLQDFIDKC